MVLISILRMRDAPYRKLHDTVRKAHHSVPFAVLGAAHHPSSALVMALLQEAEVQYRCNRVLRRQEVVQMQILESVAHMRSIYLIV